MDLRCTSLQAKEPPTHFNDGDRCPKPGCHGWIIIKRAGPCSCATTNPPCWACESSTLGCDVCDFTVGDRA